MRHKLRFVSAGILFVLVFSCGGKDEKTGAASAFSEAQSRIFIDTELTSTERQFLETDFQKLRDWKIQDYADSNPTLTQAYSTVFGSVSASPDPYVFERVKALISVTRSDPEEDERIVASNAGLGLWLNQMAKDPRNPESFFLGGFKFTLDSSRVGIVQLGKAYSRVDSPVFRVTTLVHEARHSDCPEGITDGQIEDLKAATRASQVSDILGTCGFAHIICTEGELEGLFGCERPNGWGSYAVESVFVKGLYQACANCTETERQHALITYADGVERIQSWKALSQGEFGLPDMRQQAYRGQ